MRLERTVSWSQTRRDTNFAIPGYSFFCHDTTASGKNKDFPVCGHLCGQSRFCAVFGNRGKSSKRRCRKALRRFASHYPGYRHGTPKPPALPTALIPDIRFSAWYHAEKEKASFSCLWAVLWSSPIFRKFFNRGISTAIYCPKDFRGSAFGGMDSSSILPNHACCQLRYIWS